MTNRWIAFLTIGWLVIGMTGCATSSFFKLSKNDFPKAGPKNPVAQIVGIWEPAMGIGLENKTSRGFAGQILFFRKGSDVPLQVDGDIRIYVFDDHGTPDEQATAIYEMNFDSRGWNQFLTKGPLGATYNVFTPYIREGYHEAKCTLRVRYQPAGGAPVYSDMVNIGLEGRKKSAAGDAEPADYDSAANGLGRGGPSGDAPASGVASRKRPKSRGIGETILMPDERLAASARRPAAAELTDDERARIIREARARLKAETNGRIALVSHDESASEATAVGKRPTSRPSWNGLRDEVDREDEDANDAGVSLSPEESIPAAPRRRGSRREHVLFEDKPLSAEREGGSSSEANDRDGVGRPQAHVLDDAE